MLVLVNSMLSKAERPEMLSELPEGADHTHRDH